uniref:Class II heat shock protein n=1 Tax=Tanacetum cinerariifolium TaxID=118510 RepID=A0A6L2NMB1_TANCI|nr:class II heat shock protein [Tanacetum cinerariifolium]
MVRLLLYFMKVFLARSVYELFFFFLGYLFALYTHFVTAWVAEGGRMVLCYVQGSRRRKRKKGVGCGSERHENYRSGRRDCGVYPESWIFAITEYFSLLNTPADPWLKIVGFNLEGATTGWFQWMTRNAPVTGTMTKTFGNNGGDEPESSGPVTPKEEDDQSFAEEKSYLSSDQYCLSKQILMDEDKDELNLLRPYFVLKEFIPQTDEFIITEGQVLGKTSMVHMDDFCIVEDQHGSGTVAEYESEFLMIIKRVTKISESLLKSFYISGLKPLLQCALLRLAPTTLGEAFSIACIMEARFETIAGKKLNIEEKIDIVLSWPSEEAPPVIKGSLDANEDIGVVEVSSAIDDVFDIGESNVESIEFHSKFSEFSENKESVKERTTGLVLYLLLWWLMKVREFANYGKELVSVMLMDNGRNHKFVQPNVWGWMSDSQSAYSSYHLEGKVIFEGGMVLCYVQGSERRKRKTGVGCGSGRHENYESERRDCGRIRIWDPAIKI